MRTVLPAHCVLRCVAFLRAAFDKATLIYETGEYAKEKGERLQGYHKKAKKEEGRVKVSIQWRE